MESSNSIVQSLRILMMPGTTLRHQFDVFTDEAVGGTHHVEAEHQIPAGSL